MYPESRNPHLETSLALRRPLVGIALAVASGMAGAATGLFSFGVLFFAALFCILLAGLLFRTKASGLLVFCCVALVAACRFVVAALPLSEAEINRLQPQLPLENVQLVGRVLDPPEYHAYRSGDLGVWVVPFGCEGVKFSSSPQDGGGTYRRLSACPERGHGANLSINTFNSTRPPSTSNSSTVSRNGPDPKGSRSPAIVRGEVSRANSSNPWKKYRGRIQVRVTGTPPGESFWQGERIRFSGTLRKRDFPGGDPVELVVSAPAAAPQPQLIFTTEARSTIIISASLCPLAQRVVKKNCCAKGIEPSGKESSGWDILSGPPRFSPVIWGQRLREAAAQTLSNGIESHSAQRAVYKALLLGYRKAIPPEIHQRFKRTGTLHIFAISGLHVGIVGLLITIVLKTIGIPRDRWGLWLLPLLLAYVVATGMKSSALRALAMAAVYFLSPLFRRKPDVPVSIAFAVLLLLFFKPLEIRSAGFIFSFTVVSFIVMVFAGVPKGFVFHGAGWVRAIRAYVASLGITSVAAFIASVPVTALFFGSFATVSLFANLIVVPLTFCIVLSGWLSIILPVASEIFNHAALVFINGLLGTAGALAGLPGAHVHMPPPPLTALLFWYCGWIHLFVHARTARQRTASFVLVFLSIALTLL